ncbi:MAG: type IV secretion system protein VirB4 [Rickettsiales bacterium]|jgi:type IV secretion system protein VirB4
MAKVILRRAKKQKADPKSNLKSKQYDEDFIPFVCHFDENTILTKNGELLQVIKITGFNHESISSELVTLRETVREAIHGNIKTSDFAIWLHTIRRKKNIAPEGDFDDYFSNKLNDDWHKANGWENQFVNEFYLTIIIQGRDTSIINFQSLLRSFSIGATNNLHIKSLESAHEKLSTTTDGLLEELDHYGARLLGIKEWDGVLYSEPMHFFDKIVNLKEERFPLRANDISSDLSNSKIAFGNQSLEVSRKDSKNFATMLSIKEYREVSIEALEKFIQLPQEFIVTQSLDFISRDQALPYFEYQNYILEVSGDEEFRYLSDIEHTIESDTESPTDYAQQQITIMLINDSVSGLENDTKSALMKLHSLGLVSIREDTFSEHCFWSQLPGNFQFLRRQNPITTNRVAGFASLQNFPVGNRIRNHWGSAVSIFRTILGTPYFFNFHNGDNGHTLIVGPHKSGKTVLLNFLTSQSRKFKNKLYYFGYRRSGNIFINSIQGNYLSIREDINDEKRLKMNPLLLPDNLENRKFLSVWIGSLVNYGKEPIRPDELKFIPTIVDKIVDSKTTNLSKAADFFKKKSTQNIYKKLSIWHGKGKYSYIFDNLEESDLSINLVNAFNLTSILDFKPIVTSIACYLMHKIESLLDGDKVMIVLDEAWEMLDNYITGPAINEWLARLRKKNCIVIFATQSIKDGASSSITHKIHQNLATQIFFPDPEPTQYYKSVFGLNDSEFELLSVMNKNNYHFLFKYADNSVVASLDLSDLYDNVAVLSSKNETLSAMEEAINKFGSQTKDWLPEFFRTTNLVD